MTDPQLVDDPYGIRAAGLAASLPRTVIKHDDAFIVADPWGDFSLQFQGGLGFFHGGTRFLHYLELRLCRERPLVLGRSISEDNLQIAVDLTNPDLSDARSSVPANALYIQRLITLYGRQLFESFTITSYLDGPVEVPLELRFAADWADIFEVRGTPRAERGQREPPEVRGQVVRLAYRGRDGLRRWTELRFGLQPDLLSAELAVFRLRLSAQRPVRITVAVTAEVEGQGAPSVPTVGDALRRLHEEDEARRREMARITSSNAQLNAMLARAAADLRMLQTQTVDGPVTYAGIPWFATVFGRDSLITALQLLPFDPRLAASTLRLLARHQARADDAFTDAEPGKILHEYRTGEMANCREIPFIPYYGSVDATPLFLVLFAEYIRRTGDLALARDLWPAAQRALGWMDGPGDADGDGYLEYARRSPQGLANQGWKDAWDAVMYASGELARRSRSARSRATSTRPGSAWRTWPTCSATAGSRRASGRRPSGCASGSRRTSRCPRRGPTRSRSTAASGRARWWPRTPATRSGAGSPCPSTRWRSPSDSWPTTCSRDGASGPSRAARSGTTR